LLSAFQNSAEKLGDLIMNIATPILFVTGLEPIMHVKLFTNEWHKIFGIADKCGHAARGSIRKIVCILSYL